MKINNQASVIMIALYSLTMLAGEKAVAKDYFPFDSSANNAADKVSNDAVGTGNNNQNKNSKYYISSPMDLLKKQHIAEKRREKLSQAQATNVPAKNAVKSSNIVVASNTNKSIEGNDAASPFDFTVPKNNKSIQPAANKKSSVNTANKAVEFKRKNNNNIQIASIDKKITASMVKPAHKDDDVTYISETEMFQELGMVKMANNAVRGQDNAEYQKIGSPYQANGKWYIPAHEPDYDEKGVASWYGSDFNGKKTANGETYDMDSVTVAHPTLPLPSLVEVTNLDNGRTIIARVNDRGPFASNRLIDVSKHAAELLGFKEKGTANVRVRYVGIAPAINDGIKNNKVMMAKNEQPSIPVKKQAFETKTFASISAAPTTKAVNIKRASVNKSNASKSEVQVANVAKSSKDLNFVQVAAFSSRENAERFAQTKKEEGMVKIAEVTTENGVLYRVLLAA